jgi:hypothetical protein
MFFAFTFLASVCLGWVNLNKPAHISFTKPYECD